MKQRITVEQLQELTPEQQERLRGWWQPEDGNWIFDTNNHQDYSWCSCCWSEYGPENFDIKTMALPVLSIGQCIELLGDKLNDIISPCSSRNSEPDEWQVYGKDGFCDADELIDALWEAVKEVL